MKVWDRLSIGERNGNCFLGLVLTIMVGAIGVSVPVQAHQLDRRTQNLPTLGKNRNLKAQVKDAPIAVTGVKLQSSGNKLEVRLETTSKLSIPTPIAQDNTLEFVIPNAILTLPNGESALEIPNPEPGIAKVSVTQADNSVRIRAIATDTLPPQVSVVADSSNSDTSKVAQTPDTELEINLIAPLRNNYRQPDTSTAIGTNTSIIDTPLAVQVIPQAVIRDRQSLQIKEAIANVSGISYRGDVQGRSGNTFISRGFDDVQVLRDGFRRFGASGENSAQPINEIANLESIEVLKGPASILYGAIEPGGLINLVSKKPTATPFAEAELQLGNRSLFRPRFDISGAVTANGKVNYRLNGLYQTLDSFQNLTQKDQRYLLAPVISWQIDDRTDLLLSTEYIDANRPANFGIPSANGRVIDIPRDRIINEPSDNVITRSFYTGYRLNHKIDSNWKLSNGFRYSSSEYDFGVIALPLAFDPTTNTVTRSLASQDSQTKNYTFQTNLTGELTTGDIKHTLLIGTDYVNRNSRTFSRVDFTPRPLNVLNPVYGLTKPNESDLEPFGGDDSKASSWGFFVQDQVSLGDNLKLLAGIRYDTVAQRTVNLDGSSITAGETNLNATAWTPRLGLVYKLTNDLSLYGSYSQSFSPNTATAVTGIPLDPQRGQGYDVGVKADLLDNKLLATLGYFDITRQNVPTTDPNNPLFSIATGEQRSRGIEFDLSGEVLPGLKIIGSYAYIDANVTADSDPTNIGKKLFGVPQHSASLWATYEIQRGDLQGLGFGLGFNAVGERQGDTANTYTVGSYLTTDAAIFYKRDDWRFALNFKNIGDVKYIDSTFGNAAAGNTFGDPFTVIGSVSLAF